MKQVALLSAPGTALLLQLILQIVPSLNQALGRVVDDGLPADSDGARPRRDGRVQIVNVGLGDCHSAAIVARARETATAG